MVVRLASAPLVSWWVGAAPPEDPLGPVDQNPDAVRDEACRVVSQNTTSCATPKPTPTPAPRSGGTTDLSFLALLAWLLLFALVIGLLVLLVRWADAKFGSSTRKKAAPEDDADEDVIEDRVVVIDRSREPGDWRSEADEHRRAGRFREALRCRYRGLVGDLARRGVIDEIPGRTTGEHRRQMHDVRPALAPLFDEAADLFDGAWYGHYDVDERDDDRFATLARDVMSAAGDRR